jgi:2-iminobutanoate/2-iminopropanoate deaminase
VHMRRVIEAAGGRLEDIIKVTIWMADRSRRDAVNHEWLKLFPEPASRPARHSLQADLDHGQLVVCDFVAVIDTNAAAECEGS